MRQDKDEMPRVSALVPCYNSAAFLKRTLDSLAVQTWQNFEILIGDDRSTDTTLEVARKFAEGRENVRILNHRKNLGWLGNSNDLMANASGDICFFAFHDDTVSPDYVEKLASQLVEHPPAILAFSQVSVAEADGLTTIHAFPKIVGVGSTLRRGLIMADKPNGWWVPNRGLFRIEAFHRIGGLRRNDAGEYMADWTWLLHMSLLGEFACVPETLCFKYYQPKSLSKNWPGEKIKNDAALLRAAIREVGMSHVGSLSKLLLQSYLRNRPIARRLKTGASSLRQRVAMWNKK